MSDASAVRTWDADGRDWEERVAHMAANGRRAEGGEAPIDYRTGPPIVKAIRHRR